ncbi:transporter substrate-binding domain-containing protein [Azospirillum picis]|uniref:Octopine/nopaline transport system substrate-binding protein n=1 Tax=Azospirillum picis TaxID=488438 RepID=A0ABU0MUL6_9PROT|nr:transporter substrate-binding domain-containing protein [Azospirillum picis]MBP2303346.1 octopine/nopaline transport system substrate-binding protein [Azospirillum picis]MDQ0537172.1 octopine/nopaline transport system substrate-binding protein [Azospirillum picis]
MLMMVRPALLALALLTAAPATADTLRIATEGAFPPWNAVDAGGQLQGFEIDLARDLCRRMEADCDVVAQDWDGILPGLQQGRYDAVMAAVSITAERARVVDFSTAYAADLGTFAVRSGSPLAAALPQLDRIDLAAPTPAAAEALAAIDRLLAGKRVGVQISTTHARVLAELFRSATVRSYDTADHAALDLAAGRLDAVLTARSSVEAMVKAGQPIAAAGPLMAGGPLGQGAAAAVRKGDPLAGRLSAAIEAAGHDGTTAALSRKWFGFDLSLPR